ncbi:MAG TPA: hypothetical protein VEF90_15970 [Xanthobacteraceae bacterium]|nr:hypothetical protein [Xanthobacteraceae bacterium]
MPAPATQAQPAKPEMKPAAAKETPPAKPTAKMSRAAARAATRERLKKCAAEWKEMKAAGKVEKGMKWPKFWSACNKRLKAGG